MKSKVIRANERQTSKAPAGNFVGDVWQDPVFSSDDAPGVKVTRVTFNPGARTNWHKHASGQVLYVLSGTGRYQLEGDPVQEISAGDTVVIPPDARHWHGAAPNNMMVHLAYSNLMLNLTTTENSEALQKTTWQESVSDPDYSIEPVDS